MQIKATQEDIEALDLILKMLGEPLLDDGEKAYLQALTNCVSFNGQCDYYNYIAKLLLARAGEGQCEQGPFLKLIGLMECQSCPLPSTILDVVMPLKCGSVDY